MKKLPFTICAFFVSVGFATAGISNSPWSFSKTADEWSLEDKDQEIAEGVKIEFMVLGEKSAARLVALSAPVIKKKNALKEFAEGIRESFAKNGVIDLKEAMAAKWGFDGLGMAFAIPNDGTQVKCRAFYFENDGKFWAVMAFGSEQEQLAKILLTLNKKRIEQGGGGQPATRSES